MTLWVKVKPLKVNHHPAKFGGHRLCGSGDIFSLSSDFSRPHGQNITRMYGWEPLPSLVALATVVVKIYFYWFIVQEELI